MKKMIFLLTAFCLLLSACAPAASQTQATSPAPSFSEADIQATVAVQVQQTIESLPTPTLAPTNTPVVMPPTSVPTQQPSPTETQTALPTPTGATVTLTVGVAGTLLPVTETPNPALSATPTGESQYQYYGTMPPNLPSGKVFLSNMSKADGYISMQCTTSDGYVTIIEYPVGGSAVSTSAPAGRYVYVAWVGGKKFTGNFKLGKSEEVVIRMYKDRVEVK